MVLMKSKLYTRAKAFSKLAQVTEFQSFIHCSTVSYGEGERVHGIPCSFSRCAYYCIKTIIEITPDFIHGLELFRQMILLQK